MLRAARRGDTFCPHCWADLEVQHIRSEIYYFRKHFLLSLQQLTFMLLFGTTSAFLPPKPPVRTEALPALVHCVPRAWRQPGPSPPLGGLQIFQYVEIPSAGCTTPACFGNSYPQCSVSSTASDPPSVVCHPDRGGAQERICHPKCCSNPNSQGIIPHR